MIMFTMLMFILLLNLSVLDVSSKIFLMEQKFPGKEKKKFHGVVLYLVDFLGVLLVFVYKDLGCGVKSENTLY